jgi:hypothetical protein
MAMKPPDEAQPADQPDRHHGQIRLACQRLPEGQHDERHGDYAKDEECDFDPVQTARRWGWF